ncbi:four helix bundle protein [Aurantibacillus circumpalustris]|uniref:four helix bundle protein n=1 Tax=Aurantibacillus circumpalustris TaxID=3036359 RepID=UPI00295C03FD|nr:four helix bundle protein [Aurantibacillus circumpalustris]
MGSFKKFEEIVAWQKARLLTKEIYLLSNKGKFEKDFSLKDQVRRSAVSVMANIAEGFDRRGDKEFARFLNISKGSLSETKSHLYVALDVDYINEDTLNVLAEKIDEIGKLISGLINYLKKE